MTPRDAAPAPARSGNPNDDREAAVFANATLVESRSLEHARTLGASRLGLKPSAVELEVLEHPGAHRETFLVRVLALEVGRNLAGELSSIEKRLGALPRLSLDPALVDHAVARPGDYDEILLESAMAEVDRLLDGDLALDPEVARSIKQLSLGLNPNLRDKDADLRLEAVRREEETRADQRSPDGDLQVQPRPDRREAFFIFRPPRPGGRPLAESDARRLIAEAGCIPPPPADLARVLARVREPRAGHCMMTLPFRPGRFLLQVSPDEMEVTLCLHPPGGDGEAVTTEQVREAVRQRKPRVPVDETAIDEAVARVLEERAPVFDVVLARGRLAEPGTDGGIEWKVPAVRDENGTWNLDPEADAVVVAKGHVLATTTEPTPGTPGITVLGRMLPPRAGKPCPVVTGPAVRKDAQGRFLATGPGRVGLRRNILAVTPFQAARAELVVDAQKTRAELVLHPPIGGAPGIGIADVEALIVRHEVSFCVDYELIHELLRDLAEKKRRVSGVIAIGIPPLAGRPGFLDVPVQDVIAELQSADQVDHRERSAVRRVRAGETVGLWYPPDPGSPGVDVTGRELPQPPVPDRPVEPGTGVEQDGPVYRATRDGHLVVTPERLSVEDVFHVRGDLTMATGNIRHNGTVVIDGNVGDNFVVQAEGEVVIRDNLAASEITAVGNVRIGNGFVGRQRGIVRAGGDAQVKFVEQARITARGSLRVQQNALQARLESEGLLEVNGPRAGIVGGCASSRAGVRVTHAGSVAQVPTRLETGHSPAIEQRAALLEDRFQRVQNDLCRLDALETALKANLESGAASAGTEDALRRIAASRLALKAQLKETGIERVRVARERQAIEPGTIVVTGTAHPGVTVAIAGIELLLDTPLSSVRFSLDETGQQIRFDPLRA